MERYDQCQKIKNRTEIPVGKLRLNTILERLYQYILVDFIMKLLVFKNHNSILIVCDKFSKILHFIVTIEKIIVEGLMKLFRSNV